MPSAKLREGSRIISTMDISSHKSWVWILYKNGVRFFFCLNWEQHWTDNLILIHPCKWVWLSIPNVSEAIYMSQPQKCNVIYKLQSATICNCLNLSAMGKQFHNLFSTSKKQVKKKIFWAQCVNLVQCQNYRTQTANNNFIKFLNFIHHFCLPKLISTHLLMLVST